MIYEIYSTPRSGSTYLYKVINHFIGPEYDKRLYHVLGEPFNKEMWRGTNDYNTCFNLNNPYSAIELLEKNEYPNLIIKNLTQHYDQIPPEVLERFKKIPKKRIIILRDDLFEKIVSLFLCENLRCWSYGYDEDGDVICTTPGKIENKKIKDIEPMVLEKDKFKQKDFKEYAIKEIRKDIELRNEVTDDDIVVNYKDFEFVPRIDFYNLGLVDIPFDQLPEYKRSRSAPAPKIQDYVINLEELRKIFTKVYETMV